MDFPDRPPSDDWTPLTFKGVRLADVWFKPGGDPLALVFRVPQGTFDVPGVRRRLTADALLRSVGVSVGEVESWDHGGAGGALSDPLPPPPPGPDHLEVRVRLRPPPGAADPEVSTDPPAAAVWDDLVAVWRAILGVEAAVEAARKNVESARAELESAARGVLGGDVKVHAVSADVANWTRAKGRAQFALPRANDFIHRATWAATAAERKALGAIFEDPAGPPAPLPPADQLLRELENLRKARQILAAQGTAVYQDCRAIAADVQGALRTLQANAATRAAQKRGGKGRSF